MPDIKISDLTAAASATGAMQLEVNDSATSKRITVDQIKSYILTAGAITSTELNTDAVTTVKIQNGAVTPAKLSTGAPSWDTSSNLTVSGNINAGAVASVYNSKLATLGNIAAISNNAYEPQVNLFGANSTAGSAPYVIFNKARGTIAASTIVTNGDVLGSIMFSGFDGTNYDNAASINAVVDNVPGTNDMPGRLVFSTTPDGSTTPFERMRIDSSGNVGIGGPNSGSWGKLEVRGTGYQGSAVLSTDASGAVTTIASNSSNEGRVGTTTNHPLWIMTNGVDRLRIGTSGQIGIGGANYGTAGQVLVSQGASAAPIWGSAGGMVLLGNLTTTSGTTQTLSGLTLTNYKLIVIAINRTSHNSGTSQGIRLLDANGSTQLSLAATTGLGAFTSAIVTIDLATGVFSGTYDSTNTTPPYSQTTAGALCGKSTFSTSATSLQFSYSGGSFDAGSITVYGVQ